MGENFNLILGSSYGYELDRIEPFLRSCQRNVPSAKVVLFTKQFTAQEEEAARSLCSQASYYCPSDHDIRERIQGTRFGGRALSLLNYFQSRGNENSRAFPTRLTSAFHVAVARYFWYLDWLRDPGNGQPGKILLSDTRDVVFQSDPFFEETKDALVCGLEPVTMGSCMVNRSWYSHCYGSRNLERIATEPVICSGVTLGYRETVLLYLEAMCEEILRVGRKIVRANGYDQSIHNHLLRAGLLEDQIQFSTSHDGLIATLHHMNVKDEIVVGPEDCLRNKDGRKISIIHQYDRHPDLLSAVNRQFAKDDNWERRSE